MFSQGLSSVLGSYVSTEKKRFNNDDDDWYIPYNGPYEAPPPSATVWKRKQRDSWGDPILLPSNDDKLGISVGGDVEKKIYSHGRTELQADFMGGAKVKYGVHGVFDEDWNGVAGCYSGTTKEWERAKCKYCFFDYKGFLTSFPYVFTGAYRRSTISTGGSNTTPEYISSDGMSGGVGESPVPHRRSSNARRTSFASIFTFGGKMRSGSPARTFGSSRDKRRDSIDSVSRRSRQNSLASKDKDQVC